MTRTIALVSLILVFVWLSFEVSKDQTLSFDSSVRNAIHQVATPPVTSIMIAMSFIGEPYIVWPLTGLAFIMFWRSGYARRARLLLIAMAGEATLEQTMKFIIQRQRPQSFFHYPQPTSYSFPSGHAFSAMVFFGILATLLPLPSHRILTCVLAALMIAGIGFSRIYLGVHYPSDVIGGYIGGLAWLCALWGQIKQA